MTYAEAMGVPAHTLNEPDQPKDEEIIRVLPEYIKESGCAAPLLLIASGLLTLMIFL